ncbi:MAG: hypothetical protein WAL75_16390, partial [Terracidiphilus sp.]
RKKQKCRYNKKRMSSADSHPSDKNKDVRWMGHIFIPLRVGDAGEGLIRNKTGCLQLGLCGIPPIEQKTLDGWGTPMFHPTRVEDAGGGLLQNRFVQTSKSGLHT